MGRTGQTELALREMLNRETYLTAAEAVELGFADVVEPIVRRSASAMAEALAVPESVLAQLSEIENPAVEPVVEPIAEPIVEASVEPVTEPAVEPEVSNPAAIATLCHQHGFSAMAGAWIAEGITESECAARVLAAKAASDAARLTTSTITDPVVSEAAGTWAKVLNRTTS